MAWKDDTLEEHMKTMAKFWRKNGVLARGKEDLISHFEHKRLTK